MAGKDEPFDLDIPTLEDLVSPGPRPARPWAHADKPFQWEGQPAPRESPRPRHEDQKSAFEVRLEAMVREILDRHVAAAREEIIRSVLAEVRARVTRPR